MPPCMVINKEGMVVESCGPIHVGQSNGWLDTRWIWFVGEERTNDLAMGNLHDTD